MRSGQGVDGHVVSGDGQAVTAVMVCSHNTHGFACSATRRKRTRCSCPAGIARCAARACRPRLWAPTRSAPNHAVASTTRRRWCCIVNAAHSSRKYIVISCLSSALALARCPLPRPLDVLTSAEKHVCNHQSMHRQIDKRHVGKEDATVVPPLPRAQQQPRLTPGVCSASTRALPARPQT